MSICREQRSCSAPRVTNMSKEKILIVEDEEDILELVRYNLAKEGYRIEGVGTGEAALEKAKAAMPDLILLDLLLPGLDGLEVCRILKSDGKTAHIPVVMLTAKSEDADVVAGLELGADDYVIKPFSPRVLIARIKAVLRRQKIKEPGDQETVRVHNLIINPGRHEVLVGGKPIDLSATEFAILNFIARRPGWVFTRGQIITGVKGEHYPVTDRSVDVQIVGMRKKLGPAGKNIETVRGVGYRFKE
jgi:two-component system alkaline phosphatase synthesis response regulator PhoP